ncbi:MAG: 50S ribosomal protein L10 [Thermoguttaceae bacterium]
MSKFVKQLLTDNLKSRLTGVNYAMLISYTGINANANHALRSTLAEKGINISVIKNSMARRAAKDTPLAPVFDNLVGACAICWGASDVVALAKELVKLTKDKTLKGLEIKAAVLDGEALDSAHAVEISKWPTREEQIAILLGQICGVGSKLSSQLISIGGALASQIKQKGEGEETESVSEATVEAATTEAETSSESTDA